MWKSPVLKSGQGFFKKKNEDCDFLPRVYEPNHCNVAFSLSKTPQAQLSAKTNNFVASKCTLRLSPQLLQLQLHQFTFTNVNRPIITSFSPRSLSKEQAVY